MIITVDDDIIYQPDLIESLVRSWQARPGAVSAGRVNLMRFGGAHELVPYEDWIFGLDFPPDTPCMQLLAVGCGGVLYPPGLLDRDAHPPEEMKAHCLNADDLWLKLL